MAPRSELRQLSPETAAVLKLDEQLTVAGVVSRSGWSIDDALIVLTDASGESVGATRTREDGHYALGLPPLGCYVLTALDPHTAVAQSEDVVISAQRRRFNLVLPELRELPTSDTATPTTWYEESDSGPDEGSNRSKPAQGVQGALGGVGAAALGACQQLTRSHTFPSLIWCPRAVLPTSAQRTATASRIRLSSTRAMVRL